MTTTFQTENSIPRAIYEGFAHGRLETWDAIFHPDVQINSPAGRDMVGLGTLKDWVQSFLTAFRPRVDLIDEYVAGDRGLVTINLHWTHDGAAFFGIEPTGTSGTSVENFLLRLKDGKVTHFDVADASLDLAIYIHEQGMAMPRGIKPAAIISG
jgi:ketosteroid isomerase-like protein